MEKVENYKIEYFPKGENISNKMLKSGKPVKQIRFVHNGIKYDIRYNFQAGNYEMSEDGLIAARFAYKNGKLHGKFCRYELFPCGISGAEYCPEIVREGHYINGKKVGRWNFYEYSPFAWITNEKPTCTTKIFCEDKDVTKQLGGVGNMILNLQSLQKRQL